MYAQYAERLRRTKWKDANELAEELYAILSNFNLPLSHGGPITLNQPGNGQPALAVEGSLVGDTIIQINPGPRQPSPRNNQPSKDFNLGNGGTLQLPGNSDSATSAGQAGSLQSPPDGLAGYVQTPAPGASGPSFSTGADPTPPPADEGAPSGLIGYTVLLTTGKTITAYVLQLSSLATIPQGTGVLVVKIGQNYFIQPPVWL